MKFDLSSQNTRILQEQKKHRQWVLIFLGLSVTVILGTVAALKLYGQALTHKVKVLDCQAKVHEHTDECYVYDEEKEEDVLVCGFADYLVHVHNDDCRDGNGRLVCPLEEIEPHKHADACFEEQQVLVCELEGIEPAQGDNTGAAANQPAKTPDGGEESQPVKTPESESQPEGNTEAASQPAQETAAETEAPTAPAVLETTLVCIMTEHTHTDACYGEAEPACTMTEHTHGDGCYERALTCDKNEHQHDDSCNDEEGNLICELEEHAHEDGCYEEKLICEEEEHSHTDACAAGEATLTCEAKEHTHTDACYEQVAARTEAPETTAPAETKAPETEAPETTAAPTTVAAETTAAETTAAPETTAEAGTHIHTADCYETKLVPICGKLENHIHDDDCYDENGKLICELLQLEEHRHDKDCFKTVELTSEEIAALNAGAKLHIHHDDCYDENGELICGHEETHIHGEKCYDRNGKLICGHEEAHVHSDGCYDKNGDIICGLEVVLHEHRDDCYDENGKLICDHAHIHEESCFDEDGNMTCDFEEVGDYLWTCEEEDYIVTVKFNQEAEIPGNAKLLAEQITADGENQEYFAQREEEYKEAMKDETAEMRALLHIGFYVENKEAKENEEKLIEIEPKKPVTVTVQFLDEDGLKEGEPITVVHFADEGTELLDGGQAEDNRATFEMNGFSEIAIGYGDEGAKAEVSVSGNEINDGDGSVSGNEIEKEKTIHLDDSFEYDAAPFHITFHVKGEAKGADGQILFKDQPVTDTELPAKDNSAFSETGEEGEVSALPDGEEGDQEDHSSLEEVTDGAETAESLEEEKDGEDTSESSEAEENQTEENAGNAADEENAENPVQSEENAAPAAGEDDTAEKDAADGENAGGEENGEVKENVSDEAAAVGTATTIDKEKLELNVESLEDDPLLNEAVTDYLGESTETIQRRVLCMFSYDLAYDGVKLDLSDCTVTAEVTLNRDTQKAQEYLASITGDSDAGIATVADADEGVVEDTDAHIDEAENTSLDAALMVLSVSRDRTQVKKLAEMNLTGQDTSDETAVVESDSNIMALADESTSNPTFTVQYYAYAQIMEDEATGADDAIDIINTCLEEGVKGKAQLPQNNIGQFKNETNLKKMYIKQVGTKKYDDVQNGLYTDPWEVYEPIYKERNYDDPNCTDSLVKLYTADRYEFKEIASGLDHINKFAEEGLNFDLYELWVLEKPENVNETNKEGWKVYRRIENEDPDKEYWEIYSEGKKVKTVKTLSFTNSSLVIQDDVIVIKDNTVIRLVGKSNSKDHNYPARFFDYDYTGGYTENGKCNIYLQGINDPSNYPENIVIDNNTNLVKGAVYGFGNGTTGSTGLQLSQLDRFNINQANTPADKSILGKCSYGLVQNSLSASGYPQIKANAPDLFSPENGNSQVKGKTEIPGRSLNFKRDGDTYTLMSVGGSEAHAQNLNQFQKAGQGWKSPDYVYTNQFWPMDNAPTFGAENHDPKFGEAAVSNALGVPISDDGKMHNFFFGMTFEVEFELTDDYVGPLNYYFFGDDDMWVFLEYPEGEVGTNGKTTELICDIGGVHQAAGEYVDLWNYIQKPQDGDKVINPGTSAEGELEKRQTKKYKLKFFYTERGASGSTCWMQFTLPSVNAVPVIDYTGNVKSTLTMKKTINGAPSDEQFDFTITFSGNADNIAFNTYPYKITRKNGKIEKGDISSGGKFKLGDGDTIEVFNLPDGTKYVIEEADYPNYEPGLGDKNTTGTITKDETVEGNIDWEKDDILDYINKEIPYNLPETGGPGSNLYTMAGAICLVFGAGFMYRKKFRGRRV